MQTDTFLFTKEIGRVLLENITRWKISTFTRFCLKNVIDVWNDWLLWMYIFLYETYQIKTEKSSYRWHIRSPTLCFHSRNKKMISLRYHRQARIHRTHIKQVVNIIFNAIFSLLPMLQSAPFYCSLNLPTINTELSSIPDLYRKNSFKIVVFLLVILIYGFRR